jgi:creatinine amidohydrolase
MDDIDRRLGQSRSPSDVALPPWPQAVPARRFIDYSRPRGGLARAVLLVASATSGNRIMPLPPSRYWQEMTTADMSAADVGRIVAILPLGAVEQHGPHLPLWVDAGLAGGIADRAMALMPPDLPAVLLPLMPIGTSVEHRDYPGTLSLSPATLSALWTEIAESVLRAGVRKIVFFNAHGGQPQVIDLVALDLRARLGMLAVHAGWYDFGLPEGLFDQAEARYGIHGGAIETSMAMHLFPALVRTDRLADFPSLTAAMAQDYRYLSPQGRPRFAWLMQDLNPAGVAGDARAATAEKGRLLVEHAARGLVDLVAEMDRFPMDLLRKPPTWTRKGPAD